MDKIENKMDTIEKKLHVLPERQHHIGKENRNIPFPIATFPQLTLFEEELQELEFKEDVV